MHIQGTAHVHAPQSINAPHRTPTSQPSTPQRTSETDQLDISPQADFVSRARDLPEIRADRVAEIRSAIEAGDYETDEKLSIALDRLLDEITG